MKHEALLCGWSLNTWLRVAVWAKADLDVRRAFYSFALRDDSERSMFNDLIALQTKWLEAGGPMCGPQSIILEAA